MANDAPSQQGWAGIIAAVKNELRLLALIVLVIGAAFYWASRTSGVSSTLLIVAFFSVLLVVILIAGGLLFYRARSARFEGRALKRQFAQNLGEEIFQAYEGPIENLPPRDQQEAYETLSDLLRTSPRFDNDEREFVEALVEVVIHRAGWRYGKR